MHQTKSRFNYVVMTIIVISVLLMLAGCSKKTTSTTTRSSTTMVTTTSTTTTQAIAAFTINTSTNTVIGTYLVDGKGMTLYWTTRDSIGKSNITGTALANWPVFYSVNVVVPPSLNASDFGIIARTDGSMQTTFKGWPLYYYIKDHAAGDTLGQGLAGVWFAVNPTLSAPPVPTTTPTTTTSTTATTNSTTATTTSASFPYQGSGTGNWSGQITYNNKTYSIGGTMSVTVDANGAFSGSISSNATGGTADTTITAQVDSYGNLTGTVSFTVSGITFVTNWQGTITASGNSLSMQGTWTSQYGSGTFSGTGNSSK
jgi:predicted lipoprotein with Yx(FWY)xxD motif